VLLGDKSRNKSGIYYVDASDIPTIKEVMEEEQGKYIHIGPGFMVFVMASITLEHLCNRLEEMEPAGFCFLTDSLSWTDGLSLSV